MPELPKGPFVVFDDPVIHRPLAEVRYVGVGTDESGRDTWDYRCSVCGQKWQLREPLPRTRGHRCGCPACLTIHGSDAARAVGRFDPAGVHGYRSRLGGPLRATRAEAEADFCATTVGEQRG